MRRRRRRTWCWWTMWVQKAMGARKTNELNKEKKLDRGGVTM